MVKEDDYPADPVFLAMRQALSQRMMMKTHMGMMYRETDDGVRISITTSHIRRVRIIPATIP